MSNIHEYTLNKLRLKYKTGQTPPNNNSAAAYTAQMQADLQQLLDLIPDVSSTVNKFTSAINELTTQQNSLSMGLGKVIGIHEAFNTSIEKLVGNITYLEQRNAQLNKTFNVSSDTAQYYAEQIREIGIGIGFSDQTLFKFNKGLKDMTGGMLMSSRMSNSARESLYGFQVAAVENLGVTDEAALGFETYARTIGTSGVNAMLSLKSLTDEISKQTGIDSLSLQRDIMEDIGNMSSDVRLNFSKMPGHLEVAVLKARALGFTMEDLDKVGESLMNIEQSVSSELEYQLLSGRRLLVQGNKSFTNEFRKAKLMGDSTKQTELMAEILENEGKTLKTNYLARQQFAEMTGMTTEQISKALEKQAIAQELGITDLMKLSGDKLTSKIKELQVEYKNDENKTKLLNDFISKSDTRTTHEKVVEDNLVTIARTIASIGGKATMKDGTLDRSNRKINVSAISDDLRKNLGKSVTEIKKTFDNFIGAQTIGNYSLRSEVAFDVLTNNMTAISTQFTNLSAGIKKVTDAIEGFVKVGLKSGKDASTTPVNDTIIIPDRGPILRPAKNDVIAAFRPNDVIHNTVNDMVKPSANTNNTNTMIAVLDKMIKTMNTQTTQQPQSSLDVNALASAIATAMQSVKVEAKIRTDDMYSANRMNNRKNII